MKASLCLVEVESPTRDRGSNTYRTLKRTLNKWLCHIEDFYWKNFLVFSLSYMCCVFVCRTSNFIEKQEYGVLNILVSFFLVCTYGMNKHHIQAQQSYGHHWSFDDPYFCNSDFYLCLLN